MILFSGNFLNTHLNYIDEYRSSIKDRFIEIENQIEDYKNYKSGFLVDYQDVIRNSFTKLYDTHLYGDLLIPPFNFAKSTLDEVKSQWTSRYYVEKSADARFEEYKKKLSLCDEVDLNQFRLFFNNVNHQTLRGSDLNTFNVQLPISLQQSEIYLDNHIQKHLSSLVDCFKSNIGIDGSSRKIRDLPKMRAWENKSNSIIANSNYSNDLVVSSLLRTADLKIFLIMLVQFFLLIIPILIINGHEPPGQGTGRNTI